VVLSLKTGAAAEGLAELAGGVRNWRVWHLLGLNDGAQLQSISVGTWRLWDRPIRHGGSHRRANQLLNGGRLTLVPGDTDSPDRPAQSDQACFGKARTISSR
jgi:hypothetical protein